MFIIRKDTLAPLKQVKESDNMRIELPEKVKYIIKKLNNSGFEAYAVGGCVRDSMLGRIPGDWDITTSAKPEQIKSIFEKTVDTGILHGTVTVLIKQEGFEVTTYRIDGEYEDARHPSEVTFTANLLEDLKRRDFTINAMAYNDESGLIDVFEGMKDLSEKKVRCVGTARERFSEDALRMLRAVRFAAQLNFNIEKNTLLSIKELSENLRKISAERIQMELIKLLTSAHPERFLDVYETGMSTIFIPEFNELMEIDEDTGKEVVYSLSNVPHDKVLRLTMLFHDIERRKNNGEHAEKSARTAKNILKRLKFDNYTIDRVYHLVRWHADVPDLDSTQIRKAIHRIGKEQYPDLFTVQRAVAMTLKDNEKNKMLHDIDVYEELYNKILENNDCLDLKSLAVTGRDLIASGKKPGKEIGEILDQMLDLVLEHPEYNKKETLLEKWQD